MRDSRTIREWIQILVLILLGAAVASVLFVTWPPTGEDLLWGRHHTFGDARVHVTRDGRVLVYDATGHPMGDPIWDSDHERSSPRRR